MNLTCFLLLQTVQAVKLLPAYRAIMMGVEEEEKARLATEFVTLATTLKAEGKWRKAREELINEPSTLAMVSSILRAEKEEERLVRKALNIIKSADYTLVEEKKSTGEEQWVPPKTESVMPAEQVLRINQMLEKVTDSLAQSTLEPVITEVIIIKTCLCKISFISLFSRWWSWPWREEVTRWLRLRV